MRGGPGNADQHRPATTSVLVSTRPCVPCPRFTGVSQQLHPWKMRPAALISVKPVPPWRRLEFETMPLLTSPSPPASVRGDKRRLFVLVIAIALVFAAVAAWSAVHQDRYGRSDRGCFSVTIPSSTGGALLHQCGAHARASCRGALNHHDRLSLLIRPACRQAGLG
jgi:hypothetical protein